MSRRGPAVAKGGSSNTEEAARLGARSRVVERVACARDCGAEDADFVDERTEE